MSVIHRPILVAASVACLAATLVWGRAAVRLERAWRRIRDDGNLVAAELAKSAYQRELHNTLVYAMATIAFGLSTLTNSPLIDLGFLLLAVPIGMTLRYSRRFLQDARLLEERAGLERRAEEVLEQEKLAPKRWAARLAPEDIPEFEGYEIGRVYEAGTGLMAGDFYDVFLVGPNRLAAVIGDVSGHGIEPSITAFQVKYLLRVFLRQYRDPAQAFEELNRTMWSASRIEEFVSLFVGIFDQTAHTLRFSSAGHPPAWFWHDGEVRSLRATGPLLTIDANADYRSREVELEEGDLLLLYTDGLAEARSGEQLFGEDRIAGTLRRDPGAGAAVLCKTLLSAARDFATTPMTDDVAIMAIRKT
jgi:serine phosphatase RsbU (regulator of sigma subunit)